MVRLQSGASGVVFLSIERIAGSRRLKLYQKSQFAAGITSTLAFSGGSSERP